MERIKSINHLYRPVSKYNYTCISEADITDDICEASRCRFKDMPYCISQFKMPSDARMYSKKFQGAATA
jgi:hypothetical protein